MQDPPTAGDGDRGARITVLLPEAAVELIARRAAAIGGASWHRPEPWVGVVEAARHLNCTPRRVYDLVEQRRMPHHREGRRLLFRTSELDDWIEERRAAATR